MKKHVNCILALVLVLALLFMGGATLAGSLKSLGYAFFVTYTQYLEPDGNIFDNISARIRSLNNAINLNLVGKDWFQKQNAAFQMAIGKQALSFGGTTMVRLKTGQLYDVMSDTDVSDDLETMAQLKQQLDAQNVPMVFAYAHTQLYEDNLLPVGVEDYNQKVADDIVNGLQDMGIATVDSREVYKEAGLTMDDATFRTDQHWSILTAFHMYGECIRALNETGALSLDESVADMDNFTMKVLENVHMGDVGARVGADSVKPDNFHLITPNFDTHIVQRISRSTAEGGGFEEREGTFEEAALYLEKLEGEGHTNRYDTYGLHRELTYFTNKNAPEGRLLILKDSFGTPVSTFFSLAAREVCALDLRKGRLSAEEIIEEFKPDAVLVVYCQEMMRGKNYMFVE